MKDKDAGLTPEKLKEHAVQMLDFACDVISRYPVSKASGQFEIVLQCTAFLEVLKRELESGALRMGDEAR